MQVLADDFLQRICRQLEWAGRGAAGERALEAVRTGLEQGMTAGTGARGARCSPQAIIDPEGGKTGIRQFMEKGSPPLPVRRDGVWIDAEHAAARGSAGVAAGELLPVGAPFYPGVTPHSGLSVRVRHCPRCRNRRAALRPAARRMSAN